MFITPDMAAEMSRYRSLVAQKFSSYIFEQATARQMANYFNFPLSPSIWLQKVYNDTETDASTGGHIFRKKEKKATFPVSNSDLLLSESKDNKRNRYLKRNQCRFRKHRPLAALCVVAAER